MKAVPVPRWSISFADLLILLLGCFVMLHAIRAAEPRAEGSADRTAGRVQADFGAVDLFEPGEARLTAEARTRLQALGRRSAGRSVTVASRGLGEGGSRLDRFELAAARSAAVARALREGGVAEDRLDLRLDQGAAGAAGQHIAISSR